MNKLVALSLVQTMLMMPSFSHAVAPPRTAAWCNSVGLSCPNGQPYAESICNTDPNIILCEDFDYPGNIVCDPNINNFYTPGEYRWRNPGLVDFLNNAVACQTRHFDPTANYPAQPPGSPSGGYLKVADQRLGNDNVDDACLWSDCNSETQDNALTSLYANGSPVSQDIHIRWQMYFSPDYSWPVGLDNKILFLYPDYFPHPAGRPAAAIDAGLDFNVGVWCANINQAFNDAVNFRVGDASDNYKMYPAGHNYTVEPEHQEYCSGQGYGNNSGPVSQATPPNQPPAPGRLMRINKGQWYTIELRYKMVSPDLPNGTVETWIDGVKVYSDSDIITCGGFGGTDSKRCWVAEVQFLGSWFNHSYAPNDGNTGYVLHDNFIVSTAYIGPPGSPVANPMPPAKPKGLKLTKAVQIETVAGRTAVDIQINPEDGSEYYLFKNGEYYSKILGDRFLDIWAKPGQTQRYELRQYKGGKWVGVEILEAKT